MPGRWSWWESIILCAIMGIVTAIVMGWLAKSRLRPRPESESRKLVYPPAYFSLGAGVFLFFAFLAIVSFLDLPDPKEGHFVSWLFAGAAALLGLPFILTYFFSHHEVSEEGMSFGRMFGKREALKWSEVVRVEYSAGLERFDIETRSREIFHVDSQLVGLPEFARLVLAHVSQFSIELHTLPILKATADGKLPEISA